MFCKASLAAVLALLIVTGHAFQSCKGVPAELKGGFGTEQRYFPSAPARLAPLLAGKDKRGRDEERKRRQRNQGNNLPPSSSSIPDRVPAVLPPGLGSHDSLAEPGSVLLRKRLELVALRQAALYLVLSWYEHVTVQPLAQAAAGAAAYGGAHAAAAFGGTLAVAGAVAPTSFLPPVPAAVSTIMAASVVLDLTVTLWKHLLSFSRYTSGQQRDYLEKVLAQSSAAVFVDAKAYGAVSSEFSIPGHGCDVQQDGRWKCQ